MCGQEVTTKDNMFWQFLYYNQCVFNNSNSRIQHGTGGFQGS